MQLRRRSAHPWRNTFLLVGGMLALGIVLNLPTFVNLAKAISYAISGGDVP